MHAGDRAGRLRGAAHEEGGARALYEAADARNSPPEAGGDAASTAEDTAVTVAALANDADADGDALSIEGVGAANFLKVTVLKTAVSIAQFFGLV